MYIQGIMVTKVQKWGNSLGLRLPKAAVREASIAEGTVVDVRVKDGVIVVLPVAAGRYRLKDLLAGIKPLNIHKEADFGGAEGSEVL